MVNVNKATDNMIGIFIFVTVVAALIPLVITGITNLSTSGIALATLFSTVILILIAVGVFKALQRGAMDIGK